MRKLSYAGHIAIASLLLAGGMLAAGKEQPEESLNHTDEDYERMNRDRLEKARVKRERRAVKIKANLCAR